MSTNIQRIRRSAKSGDDTTRPSPTQSNGTAAGRPINTATISARPPALRRGRGGPPAQGHREAGREKIWPNRLDQCAQSDIGSSSDTVVAIAVRLISELAEHRTSVIHPSRRRPALVTRPSSDGERFAPATSPRAARPFIRPTKVTQLAVRAIQGEGGLPEAVGGGKESTSRRPLSICRGRPQYQAAVVVDTRARSGPRLRLPVSPRAYQGPRSCLVRPGPLVSRTAQPADRIAYRPGRTIA